VIIGCFVLASRRYLILEPDSRDTDVPIHIFHVKKEALTLALAGMQGRNAANHATHVATGTTLARSNAITRIMFISRNCRIDSQCEKSWEVGTLSRICVSFERTSCADSDPTAPEEGDVEITVATTWHVLHTCIVETVNLAANAERFNPAYSTYWPTWPKPPGSLKQFR
jgi:hypothetical protein